ncbi:MAG: hypothetical protein ACRYGR_02390, partial [Janthinobacterium lividum]
VSTLAALIAKSSAYSLMGTSPYGNYHGLPITAVAATNATVMQEYFTFTVGTGGSSTAYVPIATRGWGDVRPLMACQGSKIQSGTTILVINPEQSIMGLTLPPSTAFVAGDTFTCGFDVSGVVVGATVSAGQNAAQSGTTVSAVTNTPGLETITFSKPITASLNEGQYWEYYSPYRDAQIASMTMDALNIQSGLINVAKTGGTLQLAAGTYNMGGTDIVLPPTTGQLPETASGVNFVGQGEFNTMLRWATDSGMGTYDVVGAFRLSGTGSEGYMSDMTLIGAGGFATPGQSPGYASVFGWPQHRVMHRVQISHGYGCMAMSGDQTSVQDLEFHDCYYGLHYDSPDSFGDFGDQGFSNMNIHAMGMAGVGCGPQMNCGNGVSWVRSGIFNVPFGFFKETSPNAVRYLFDGFAATNTQLEFIGESGYSDDQPPTSPSESLVDISLTDNEFFWGSGWFLPISATVNSDHVAYMQAFQALGQINTPREIELLTAGRYGVFDVTYAGLDVTADWDTLISVNNSVSAPYLAGIWSNNSVAGNRGWHLHAHSWDGTVCGGCNAAPGQIVSIQANGSTGVSQGNSTEYLLGVSKYNSSATQYGIIATDGRVPVTLAGATSQAGAVLRTGGTAGGAVQASGSNDTATPILGTSPDGGASSGSSVAVILKPTQ